MKKFCQKYPFKSAWKRILAHCFDTIGFSLYRPFKKNHALNPAKLRRILIVRNDHLGDVLLSKSAIDAVLAHFPQAQINLLLSAENAPLFKNYSRGKVLAFKNHWFSKNSFFDQIKEAFQIIRNLKNDGYDLGIDLRGDARNILLLKLAGIPFTISFDLTGGGFLLNAAISYPKNRHQAKTPFELLKVLGVNASAQALKFTYDQEAKLSFINKYPELKINGFLRIVVHPGAGYASKQWPLENYIVLIQEILKMSNTQVVLIGNRTEKDKMPIPITSLNLLDLRGKTQLEELPILFDLSQIFIGNDSGPAHLAAIQDLYLIILFSGTNSASEWKPASSKLSLLSYNVPCSPCSAKVCLYDHFDCLRKIHPGEAFDSFKQLLNQISHAGIQA